MMNWVYVFLGGGLGSLLRYAISHFSKTENNSFPWATFIANIVSCFIAGIVLSMIQKNILPQSSKSFLITGFCGGFSTFSALSVESLSLWQAGNYFLFFTYIITSIITGISFVLIGAFLIGE